MGRGYARCHLCGENTLIYHTNDDLVYAKQFGNNWICGECLNKLKLKGN